MGVPDGLIIVTWCVFLTMVYVSIQQLLIESTAQKSWILYRLFLSLTIIFESILLPVLLVINIEDDDDASSDLFVFMRVLVWCNNFMGGYITYKILLVAVRWLFKKKHANMESLPSWLTWSWMGVTIIFYLIRIITLLISLANNNMEAAGAWWSLWIDVYTLFGLNLLPGFICVYIGWYLHTSIRQRQAATTKAQMSKLHHSSDGSKRKGHHVQTLKRMKHARNKILACGIICFIAAVANAQGVPQSIADLSKPPESLDAPQFQTVSDFLQHFIYAFTYEIVCMLGVYNSSKCCFEGKIPADSIYKRYLRCNGNSRENCHWSKFPFRFFCLLMDAYDPAHEVQENTRTSTGPRALDVSKNPNLEGESVKKGMKEYDDDIDERDITLLLNEIDTDAAVPPRGAGAGETQILGLKSASNAPVQTAENYVARRRMQSPSVGPREDTPTQAHNSDVIGRVNTAELELQSTQKQADLNNIDREGRELGKRKKKKAKKMDPHTKQQVAMQRDQVRPLDQQMDEVESVDIAKIEDTFAPQDGVSRFEPSHVIDLGLDAAGSGVDSDMEDGRKRQPILLVIYEYEDVLATNMKRVTAQPPSVIAQIDLDTMLLVFGGVDRLEKLHEQFNEVILKNKETMCFVIGKEKSQAIFKTFERVDFAQYFVSVNAGSGRGSKPMKRLSHVIGCDHKLWQDADGKKHLLILRLMNFLKFNHENVLYISHDKYECDHAKEMNLCQTYYVKTSGLTERDLDEIARIFAVN